MSLDWVGDDTDSATVYTVSWTLRHFKPMPKLYAERNGCLWRLTDKEAADKIAAEAGRQYSPTEILACLDPAGLTDGKWYAAVMKRYPGISYGAFNSSKKLLFGQNRVQQPVERGPYYPVPQQIECFSDN